MGRLSGQSWGDGCRPDSLDWAGAALQALQLGIGGDAGPISDERPNDPPTTVCGEGPQGACRWPAGAERFAQPAWGLGLWLDPVQRDFLREPVGVLGFLGVAGPQDTAIKPYGWRQGLRIVLRLILSC